MSVEQISSSLAAQSGGTLAAKAPDQPGFFGLQARLPMASPSLQQRPPASFGQPTEAPLAPTAAAPTMYRPLAAPPPAAAASAVPAAQARTQSDISAQLLSQINSRRTQAMPTATPVSTQAIRSMSPEQFATIARLFTAHQLHQLSAQIYAYRYLARNTAVPQQILSAASGATPPPSSTATGAPLAPVSALPSAGGPNGSAAAPPTPAPAPDQAKFLDKDRKRDRQKTKKRKDAKAKSSKKERKQRDKDGKKLEPCQSQDPTHIRELEEQELRRVVLLQKEQLRHQILALQQQNGQQQQQQQQKPGLSVLQQPAAARTPAAVRTMPAASRSVPPMLASQKPGPPHDLDPRFLITERERRIAHRVEQRLAELEALPADLPKPVQLRFAIEAKQLGLLALQRKVRQTVAQGIHEAVARAVVQDSQAMKRRKSIARESKIPERIERQQRLHEEQRRRAKQKEFMSLVINHAKEFKDYHSQRQALQKKLMRAIVAQHTNKIKKAKQQAEREARERMLALKSNDEEAYRRHVDKAKNQRLKHLLDRADEYLAELGKLVQKQRRSIPLPPSVSSSSSSSSSSAASAPASASSKDSSANAEESGAEAGGDKPTVTQEQLEQDDVDQREYYEIAHSVQEEVTVQPPSLVGGQLKPYQLRGLEWLVSLYNNNLNGILADEMGLGKTIQTISLVSYLMDFKNNFGPHLIVVPLSTLNNWRLEIEKWCPSLKKVVYKGNGTQRKTIFNEEINNATFNVVLTTYDYVLRDKTNLSKIGWNYIIIDEGHRMKNSKCKLATTLSGRYSSAHRVLLTGTPLQNNLPELWALLNFLLPHIFNSADNFEKWFNAPFSNMAGQPTGESVELNEEEKLLVINRLHKVLRPFLLRRLKTDVESQLPDKVEKILRCEFSAFQKKQYEDMSEKGQINIGEGSKRGLMNTLMQLRKICNHPYLFMDEYEIDDDMIRMSGKFDLLDRMLKKLKAGNHRVLIFSQMTAIMDTLGYFFDYRGYKFLRLDGSTKADDRGPLVEAYNSPGSEYFIFMLSTRAGGLGLNLQSADTVILFDSDWNPHADLQAQDRAHRIGQQNEVRVFRLVVAGSVEETILDRALQKLDIDAQVIQAGMYNSRSKAGDRRAMLENLLRSQAEKDESDDDLPTDEEINRMLARTEEEFELFEQIDQQLNEEFAAAWTAAGKTGPPKRLMQKNECPAWLLRGVGEPANEAEKLGRGTRERKRDVVYADNLTEKQYMRLIESGQLGELPPRANRKRVVRYEEEVEDEDEDEGSEEEEEEAEEEAAAKPSLKRHSTAAPSTSSSSSSTIAAATTTSLRRAASASSVVAKSSAATLPKSGSASKLAAEPPLKRKRGRPRKNADASSPGQKRAVFDAALMQTWTLIESNQATDGRLRAELFKKLPTRKQYPDYYVVIETPMDLLTVKKKINSGSYQSIADFKIDMDLIWSNAITFNMEDSEIHKDAIALREVFEAAFEQMSADLEEQSPH